MRSKIGVEERESTFKGGGTPAEAVFGRATIITTASILYASLAACVVGKKRRLERQVDVADIICYGTHDIVVVVMEGSARARSQSKMNLCENVLVRQLKHRGWHQVAHCDVCYGTAGLLGKPRMLPSGEHESSSPENV